MNKRALIVIIIAVVLLVGGGYTALWFTQANESKEAVENTIAKINEKATYLQYESITTVGFPNNVIVRINKPTLTFPMDKIFKASGEQMSIAPDDTTTSDFRKAALNLPPWTEQLTLNGSVDILVNLMSDQFSIDANGSYTGQSHIGDTIVNYTFEVDQGPRSCVMQFAKSGGLNLWDWGYLSGDHEDLWNSFRSARCDFPAYRMLVQGSNVPVISGSQSYIRFSTLPHGGTRDAALQVNSGEYSATAQWDAMVERYYQLFYPGKPLPVSYRSVYLGNQQLEIDFDMQDFPDNGVMQSIAQNQPFNISLNKGYFKSALSEYNMTLLFANKPAGDDFNIDLQQMMEFTTNEDGYNLSITNALEHAGELYEQFQKSGSPLATWPENVFTARVRELVPELHKWGKTTYVINGNAKGSPDKEVAFTIQNSGVSLTPYSILLNGNGNYAPASGAPFPSGQLGLVCTNCINLIDDGIVWLNKAAPLFEQMDYTEFTKQTKPAVPPELQQGIKTFLRIIAPENAGVMQFQVVSGASGITINNKNIMEVMELYNQHIAPHIEAMRQQDEHSHDGEPVQ